MPALGGCEPLLGDEFDRYRLINSSYLVGLKDSLQNVDFVKSTMRDFLGAKPPGVLRKRDNPAREHQRANGPYQ
jgi:hypothetical protein